MKPRRISFVVCLMTLVIAGTSAVHASVIAGFILAAGINVALSSGESLKSSDITPTSCASSYVPRPGFGSLGPASADLNLNLTQNESSLSASGTPAMVPKPGMTDFIKTRVLGIVSIFLRQQTACRRGKVIFA